MEARRDALGVPARQRKRDNLVRQVGIVRYSVPRCRTAQSSTWAPTTITFNFRWAACAGLASDIIELIASGAVVRSARPSIDRRLTFSICATGIVE